MNTDILMLIQMIQNGDIGSSGSSGSTQFITRVEDFNAAFYYIIRYLNNGSTNPQKGFMGEDSYIYNGSSSNIYKFDAFSSQNADPIFNLDGQLMDALISFINKPSLSPSDFNKKIVVAGGTSRPVILEGFAAFQPDQGYDRLLVCKIHFSSPWLNHWNASYGIFEGFLVVAREENENEIDMDSTNQYSYKVFLDANFGVCNLYYQEAGL